MTESAQPQFPIKPAHEAGFWLLPRAALKPYYVPAFWILTCLLVLIAFGPATRRSLFGDDYYYLSFAAENGFAPSTFVAPHNGHITITTRAMMAVLYPLFGNTADGYHWVNIFLHLTNVWLVSILFTRLLNCKFLGHMTAFVFAISFSHWHTTMWLTTVNVLSATAWYSVLLIYYVKYLDTRRRRYLVLSVGAHVGMMLTFSYGLETPLLLFALFVVIDQRYRYPRKLVRAGLLLIPYIAVAVIFGVVRLVEVQRRPSSELFVNRMDALAHSLGHIGEFLNYVGGGVYEGFLKPFSGVMLLFSRPSVLPLSSVLPVPELFIAGGLLVLIIAVVLLLDWRHQYLKAHWPLLAFCAFWLGIVYALPAAARLGWSYDAFVFSSRYRYPVCLPAAAIFVVVVFHLRPYTRKGFWQVLALPTSLGFLMIAGLNIHEIRKQGQVRLEDTKRFDVIRNRFTDELIVAIGVEGRQISLVDEFFTGSFSGHLVRPSQIAMMYLTPDQQKRVVFITKDQLQEMKPGQLVYAINPLRGNVTRIRH